MYFFPYKENVLKISGSSVSVKIRGIQYEKLSLPPSLLCWKRYFTYSLQAKYSPIVFKLNILYLRFIFFGNVFYVALYYYK